MEDFQDTAKRHLHDAELLFSQEPKRLANASHLFGISAECALKAILKKSVGKFNPKAAGHIGTLLLTELSNVADTGVSGALVLCLDTWNKKQYFKDWGVEQRYAPQENPHFVLPTVSLQREGASEACKLMKNVLHGGLI